ncbi:MAG: T9SS type A sorting domain-containing protein [Melioribacteraceae bacterium]|nr:T9SS type A sorting domain-containing protein [Melioribacteraceae bacterium]MCF8355028.1 T9SS type A sorting domain-containing protein [Melioribacteraceae bacterium]MCF8392707.1 T9SS type A sorting domain-containing protein [Melioribacteraceae bacterium]MCF8417729.1 T9SS type A sorting domain-containing protein [Melioribacteraceae bacterium]
MNKNKKFYSFYFSIAIMISITVFYFSLSNPEKQLSSQSVSPDANEKYENPGSRAEHEFNMLKDPSTGKIPDGIFEQEMQFVKDIPARKNYPLSKSSAAKSYEWESIGPRNISGRTRALAYDITEENVLLAAGVSGGVFKSVDAGLSWYLVTDKSIRHSVTSIAQDTRPGKTNIWYYSSGESARGNSARATGAYYWGNGVYKSTDNGENWALLTSTTSNDDTQLSNQFQMTFRIKTDPSNTVEDEVYVASLGSISRSSDGGESWEMTLGGFGESSAFYTDLDITSTGVVYATFSKFSLSNDYNASTSGMYRSEDGINWEDITPGDLPASTNRIVLDIYEADENVVYFLAETPGAGYSGHTLWRYQHDEEGGTWSNRSEGIPHDETNQFMQFSSQGSYDLVIGVKPDDENYVFIGGTSLFRSEDGFQSPENVYHIGGYGDNDPLPLYTNHWVDQHVILFSNEYPDGMYVGNDGGVYFTSNTLASEINWQPLDDHYVTSQFYDIAIDEYTSGSETITGGLQDRGVWTSSQMNNEALWEMLPIPGDGSYSEIGSDDYPLYFSFQHGRSYVLLDNGSSYVQFFGSDQNQCLFVNAFAIDPNDDHRLYFATRYGVVKFDFVSASEINYTYLPYSDTTDFITELAVSKNPANIVYFGSDEGGVYKLENTLDEEPVYSDVTGLDMPNGYISDIWVDPNDADNVIVTFSNYGINSIYYSDNGGASWTNSGGNLEEFPDGSGRGPSVRTVDALNLNGETIYFVGTSTGLYSTTQLNGVLTDWSIEGAETIGNVVVRSLETRNLDGLIVAATHGSGIYKSTIATGIEDEGISRSFSLSQNYPNPFNPSTKIDFHLPKSSQVELKVFDALGREAATLISDFKNAGDHSINFNASNLASGTYIYRIKAGDYVESRKMIFLK